MGEQNDWYALFVTTGKEDNIKKSIYEFFKDKYKVMVPKRKMKERKSGCWTERIHTLFPGYVLINGTINPLDHSNLKKISGVIRVLCDGYQPMIIDKEEIYLINHLTKNSDIIGTSNLLILNGKVEVIDGPLTGLAGIITKVDMRKGRAKVQLKFMGEPRAIDLPVDILIVKE